MLELLALLGLIPIVGLVARCLIKFEVFKKVKHLPSYNKYKARILAGTDKAAPSVEDFRFISEDIVLLGSGGVLEYISRGQDAPEDGSMIAVDMTTEQLRVLPLTGFPEGKAFRPHGLEYSKRTGTLYVVNHANNGEERVEMFRVESPESLETVSLSWKGALFPPVPAGTSNAITEASEKDIYLTYWLPMPVPLTGNDNPKSFRDHFNHNANLAINLFGRAAAFPPLTYGFTKVMRCDLATQKFEVACSRFVSCNGIAASPDGRFIFVVDCFRQFIAVLDRDVESGKLTKRVCYEMPHNSDNVTCRAVDGGRFELSFGTIPEYVDYLMRVVKNDNRLVGGGFLRAVFDPTTDGMKFEDVLIHDGSMLTAVATAAQWKNKILMSGPGKGGVLVFDIDATT